MKAGDRAARGPRTQRHLAFEYFVCGWLGASATDTSGRQSMEFQVFGLGTTNDEVHVLIATQRTSRPPDGIELRSGRSSITLDREWRSVQTDLDSGVLWIAKLAIGDLQPGERRRVSLVDRTGTALADGTITAPPARSATRLTVLFGSCFDINSPWRYVTESAYQRLLSWAGDSPAVNFWLGDQVYVDAPWTKTIRARDSRSIIFDRYLASWGLTAQSGLAEAMASTTNYYLPDDHEFWNGYPHPSWFTLAWHTTKRMATQIWRYRDGTSTPHPSTQGEWGNAAGEAFMTFCTPDRNPAFTESVNPEQLQVLRFDRFVAVLANTRWHRTIRKTGKSAGFMRDDDMDRLLHVIETTEELLILALAKPLLGHLPHTGATRGKAEYDVPDYPRQYTALWRSLHTRARNDRPTLVLAGDVHRHSVRSGLDDKLLEIVSSPSSLLDALDKRRVVPRLRRAWSFMKHTVRSLEQTVLRRNSQQTPSSAGYPAFIGSDKWKSAQGMEHLLRPEDRSGLVGIKLELEEDERPKVEYRSVIADSEDPDTSDSSLATSSMNFEWTGTRWVVG